MSKPSENSGMSFDARVNLFFATAIISSALLGLGHVPPDVALFASFGLGLFTAAAIRKGTP